MADMFEKVVGQSEQVKLDIKLENEDFDDDWEVAVVEEVANTLAKTVVETVVAPVVTVLVKTVAFDAGGDSSIGFSGISDTDE